MTEQQPTYIQIEEQGHNATVLVPRSNGEISTGTVTGYHDTNGNPMVEVTREDGTQGIKPVLKEALSDHIQEELAETLGGMALRNRYSVLIEGNEEDIAKVNREVAAREVRKPKDEATRLAEFDAKIVAADAKYNLARQSGASHEEAERSAHRVFGK